MPEPIMTFIVSTAASVLSEFITEFVKGTRRRALQRDIEAEVSRRILQYQSLRASEVSEIVRRVTDEVKLLAIKDPSLQAKSDRIEPAKRFRPALSIRRDARVERELATRLAELQLTVTARRKELGLPTSTDEAEHESATVDNELDDSSSSTNLLAEPEQDGPGPHVQTRIGVHWTPPAKRIEPETEANWSERMRETSNRIARRRRGESLDE